MKIERQEFTFWKRYGAWTATRNALVYVPDQVLERPSSFAGKVFPVLRRDGSRARARLRLGCNTAASMLARDPVVALT